MRSKLNEVHVLRWVIGLKMVKWRIYKGGRCSVGNLEMGPFGLAQRGCFKVSLFKGFDHLASFLEGWCEKCKR